MLLSWDWQFYSAAVGRWLDEEPIYPGGMISTLGSAPGSSYAYPPASFLPFAPWPLGAIAWASVLIGVFLGGLWLVARRVWPERAVTAFAAAVLGASIFPPVLEGIGMGNVNILTAGLLGVVWAGIQPAAIAGVMTVIKVFPIALAAPSGWRALGFAASVALAICLLTLPLVGAESWSTYVTALTSVEPACGLDIYFNPSIACLIGTRAGLAIAAVALLVAVVARRKFVAWVAVVIAIMAPASELHLHYFALVYVLLWIGFAEMVQGKRARCGTTPP